VRLGGATSRPGSDELRGRAPRLRHPTHVAGAAGHRRVVPRFRARRRRPSLARHGAGALPAARGPLVRRRLGRLRRTGRPNGVACAPAPPAHAAGRFRPPRRAARAFCRRGGCGPPRRAAAVTSRRSPPSATVRVAAGQGFWGDWLEAPYRQVTGGADVVITGRVTDTGLTLAPLIHAFGWKADDWDRLAAGTVAGHTIECGAQCSGGNCLVDWKRIPDLANVGYPIVEARPDGGFD